MGSIGIEFTMKDGTRESFDPVDAEKPFEHIGDTYVLNNGYHHDYEIKADEVENIRTYDLCHGCGYELYSGMCENSSCSNYIDA